ncbi:mig-6, partial [Cordylochernes scorpioides]
MACVPAGLPLSPAVSVAAGTTALDPCCLPPDSGPCDAIFKRWYHDCETGTCRNFTYSGCGGNTNNFVTEGECRAQCGGRSVCLYGAVWSVEIELEVLWSHLRSVFQALRPRGCPQVSSGHPRPPRRPLWSSPTPPTARPRPPAPPVSPGPPMSTTSTPRSARVGTSPAASAARATTASGRGRNAWAPVRVTWVTSPVSSTVYLCDVDEIPVCCRPAYTGPCRAAMRRWYFDCETGTCQRFIYGGCQSNGNNFATQQECLRSCQGEPGVLELCPCTSHPCTGRHCTGRHCTGRHCTNHHCTGHPCTGRHCTGRHCTGHPCTGRHCTGHPCTG